MRQKVDACGDLPLFKNAQLAPRAPDINRPPPVAHKHRALQTSAIHLSASTQPGLAAPPAGHLSYSTARAGPATPAQPALPSAPGAPCHQGACPQSAAAAHVSATETGAWEVWLPAKRWLLECRTCMRARAAKQWLLTTVFYAGVSHLSCAPPHLGASQCLCCQQSSTPGGRCSAASGVSEWW